MTGRSGAPGRPSLTFAEQGKSQSQKEREKPMLFDYQAFLDGVDRKAYHEGRVAVGGGRLHRHAHLHLFRARAATTSCGVLMYTKDGKLEKVEGDPLDPCANGRLCMRCLNLEEGVNYADRPKYPLRRARQARREQVGAHHVGRGARHHRRLDPHQHRRSRLRPRVHLREPRHRPQHLVLGAVSGRRLPGYAEHRRHRVVGLFVLPAAHVRHGREHRRLPHRGRLGRA